MHQAAAIITECARWPQVDTASGSQVGNGHFLTGHLQMGWGLLSPSRMLVVVAGAAPPDAIPGAKVVDGGEELGAYYQPVL